MQGQAVLQWCAMELHLWAGGEGPQQAWRCGITLDHKPRMREFKGSCLQIQLQDASWWWLCPVGRPQGSGQKLLHPVLWLDVGTEGRVGEGRRVLEGTGPLLLLRGISGFLTPADMSVLHEAAHKHTMLAGPDLLVATCGSSEERCNAHQGFLVLGVPLLRCLRKFAWSCSTILFHLLMHGPVHCPHSGLCGHGNQGKGRMSFCLS